MSKPANAKTVDGADAETVEQHGKTVTIRRVVAAISLAGAAISAGLISAGVVYFLSHLQMRRLEGEIAQEKTNTIVLKKQYDDLLVSYGQMVAAQRCEVIDGLDDCVAAGMARPARFAESDRTLIEGRKAQAINRFNLGKEATGTLTSSGANMPPRSDANSRKLNAPPIAKSGRISESVMLQELTNIPGITLENKGGLKNKDSTRHP